jgi:hypothetical protein
MQIPLMGYMNNKLMKINCAKQICLIILASTISLCSTIQAQEKQKRPENPTGNSDTTNFGSYKPMIGSKIANSKFGDINLRIYTYVRYLNQLGLDTAYTNAFGKTSDIDRRQDVQIQKVTIYFSGWFLDPKFRYFLYLWTNNASQGLGAQVVVAGNLNYNFNKHFTLLGGIMSLPGTRSTEGNFPFWLTVDNRLISDEFFRGSYTSGIQAKGEVVKKLTYSVMLGNNLSQLGVDAGQLDAGFNTFSGALTYFPTTGEYGMINGSFGDFDNHLKAATRVGVHFTRSDEDRQGQPRTDAFENVQIRLSDGSIIFAPDLFSTGTQIDKARYKMACFDAGVKYHGFAFEGEYNWRWIDNFSVTGPPLTFDQLTDNGFQILGSAMILPKILQVYTTYSEIFGEYGDPWEFRAGLNLFPFKNNYARFNAQYIYQDRSPVGNTSLPYAVGGTGSIFNLDLEINF